MPGGATISMPCALGGGNQALHVYGTARRRQVVRLGRIGGGEHDDASPAGFDTPVARTLGLDPIGMRDALGGERRVAGAQGHALAPA